MKNSILPIFSVTILTMATIALIIALTLEIYTHEPVYMLIMKISAGLFGVGGPLLGWAIARKAKRK